MKLFDNDKVQVWNIAWLKGQPSPMHRHIYDLVGVYYEPGDRMIIAVDGSKRSVSTKAGDVVFQKKGVTHIEEGTTDAPLRSVFVEMKIDGAFGKSDKAPTGVAAFSGKTMPVLDNERVTVPTIPFDAATDPDETQPWTIGISNGPTQYLFTNDQEPTRTTGACTR